MEPESTLFDWIFKKKVCGAKVCAIGWFIAKVNEADFTKLSNASISMLSIPERQLFGSSGVNPTTGNGASSSAEAGNYGSFDNLIANDVSLAIIFSTFQSKNNFGLLSLMWSS